MAMQEETTIWTMPHYHTVASTLSINVVNNYFFQPDGPTFWDILNTAGTHMVCPPNTWTSVTNIEGRGKLGAIILPIARDTNQVKLRVTIDGEIFERTIAVTGEYRVVLTGSPPIPNGDINSYTGIGLHLPYFIQSPKLFDGIDFHKGLNVEMYSTGFCSSEYGRVGGTAFWLDGRILT